MKNLATKAHRCFDLCGKSEFVSWRIDVSVASGSGYFVIPEAGYARNSWYMV